jgi:hypothetical protein
VTNFRRPNLSIKTKEGKRLDLKRAKGVTPDKIKPLFDILWEPLLWDVPVQHRYNMDEASIMERSNNGKYLGSADNPASKKKRWVLVKGRQTRTWVSNIISAEGNYLPPPVVIYTGESVQQQWPPKDIKDYTTWQFTATPSLALLAMTLGMNC